MTARITTATGEITAEVVAARTELIWDAMTDSGKVRFHMEKVTTIDGSLVSREPAGTMEHAFDLIMARTWTVPDGQGGTVEVPTVLVMGTIKAAFDTLFNEQFGPTEPEEETP